ncbi:hypothetical protein AB0942_32885 [Streptomyces nodosus]|uniref:hypothetical protein n=1 Tax=Streptomyces nodosus TaxID=40318 RepID=UPI00345201C0
MDASSQPTLDEIEDRFVELVVGRLSRDEADRWAARWVMEDGIVWDDLSWWALNCLCGVDLPAGEAAATCTTTNRYEHGSLNCGRRGVGLGAGDEDAFDGAVGRVADRDGPRAGSLQPRAAVLLP